MTNKTTLLIIVLGILICMPMFTLFELYGNNKSLGDALTSSSIYTAIVLIGQGLWLRYWMRSKEVKG